MLFAKYGGLSVGLMKNIIIQEKGLFTMHKSKFLRPNTVQGCSTYTITQNITLNTRQPLALSPTDSVPKVTLEHMRPMVVLLEYMYAKGKHIKKIADIYLDWGFDVLQISLKPMQLLHPLKGSQIIAKDLADFLVMNKSFSPLVIHGFSVGGYLWGEALVQFEKDLEHYQSAIDRIKGQIFDSPADIEAIPVAFPASIFPNSPLRRSIFQFYLRSHLQFRYESTTKHYIKSRQMFTSGLVKAPTFFITSNADVLSSADSVSKACDEILKRNLDARIKIFDGSPHVMHFKNHQNEYISEMRAFLEKLGLISPAQMKAKL